MSLDHLKKGLLGRVGGGALTYNGKPSDAGPPPGARHNDGMSPATARYGVELPKERLAKNERGLVIAPNIRLTGPGAMMIGGDHIDPQDLRFSVLLWDKLSQPINNIIGVGPSAEEQFLMDAGLLLKPKVIWSGRMQAEHVVAAHPLGFQAHDEREPGQWSLGRADDQNGFLPETLTRRSGILFSLYEAIPIPHRDVPLNEVLEFKQRRHSELQALRYHLERLYQSILGSEDSERALKAELSALDAAIADQLNVSKQSGLKFKLSGLSATLDYKTYVSGASTFLLSHTVMPLAGALVASVGAAAAASLKMTATIERRNKAKTPLEYISSIHRDLS